MLNFTIREEWDHHVAYHMTDTAGWCMFCTTADKRFKFSLQPGERTGSAAVLVGPALAPAELRASNPLGGPQ
jgi:hypothetical protein